jgi:hypothetical protein
MISQRRKQTSKQIQTAKQASKKQAMLRGTPLLLRRQGPSELPARFCNKPKHNHHHHHLAMPS